MLSLEVAGLCVVMNVTSLVFPTLEKVVPLSDWIRAIAGLVLTDR